MEREPCRVCGGDGRVANAFGGSSATCPACHGSGRRSTSSELFHDVTKTKPSHHLPGGKAVVVKVTWPSTIEGSALGNQVKASALPEDVKARLIREIIDYESSHGSCTQTFRKKIQKQIRPASG